MSLEQDALANAESWAAWIERNAQNDVDPRGASHHTPPQDWERAVFGLLAQASAENPDGFATAFADVFGSAQSNPLTAIVCDSFWNLIRNGISDDWELFLQWREEGYFVVPENLRKDADAAFREKEAYRMLGLLTCGSRPAPGLANEGRLIQEMFKQEPFVARESLPAKAPSRGGRPQ